MINRASFLAGLTSALLGVPCVLQAQSWSVVHLGAPSVSAPAVAFEYTNSAANILEQTALFEVLYRGANQHLWDGIVPNNGSSTLAPNSYSPAVQLKDAPATIQWGNDVVVFYRGLNDHLFVATKPIFRADQAFNNPTDTGIAGLTSSPVVASLNNEEYDVLFRGNNNHLWEAHFKKPMQWQPAEDLGGVALQGAPTVVVMRDQKNKWGYQALYRGPNQHLWKSYYPADLKKRIWWSAAEDLGGENLTADPVALNLPSLESGRGIEAFYLTDSPTGTDRLRFSTWIGYDKKGNTDWWSAPQAVTIAGANFTGGLGTVVSASGYTWLYYLDGKGQLDMAVQSPPPPKPAPPNIALSAAPDNGYVNAGQKVTITWNVTNCNSPCKVAVQAKTGFGFDQLYYASSTLPPSGGISMLPAQADTTTRYFFTATGSNGSASKTIDATLAPASTTCATCTIFYFKISSDNPDAVPECFTEAVYAASASAAQQSLQTQNPGYTVSAITADQFTTACADD